MPVPLERAVKHAGWLVESGYCSDPVMARRFGGIEPNLWVDEIAFINYLMGNVCVFGSAIFFALNAEVLK